MSFFGAHSPSDVAGVAEKFIAKMDERDLSEVVADHQSAMPPEGRCALVESILDAFRHRGESSEDVAEASRTKLAQMQSGDVAAVAALLRYVEQNTGLLKEAATTLIEKDPAMLEHLPGSVIAGISAKLATS